MKTSRKLFAALVLCALNLGVAQSALAAEEFKGNWTLSASDQPGKVQFGLSHRMHGGSSQSESDWPVSVFQGLDLGVKGKRDVQFTIARDAGRFSCEGYLKDSEGAGIFHFTPDASYVQSMSALGFVGIDEEKQFAMAVHDVTLEFAKEMKGEKVSGLSTDMLIAFRIHGVSQQFIRQIRAEGLTAIEADKLIAYRIHGVSPEFVREVRKAGLQASEDQLVAMRIHGVTPEWIAQMKRNGYELRSIDDMIAFRIHGVSPEFIAKIEQLGYKHPEPDQLVAMRIHGVTPEYIANLKSRGMKDLSIDQMVSLRIHGHRLRVYRNIPAGRRLRNSVLSGE